jgi:chromate transporter
MSKKVKAGEFLKDVLILAFTAFGGPNAHIALMLERFVRRRKYLTEEELIELNALCQFLPGPTSTQTLTSVGYKMGGPRLAVASLMVWLSPAVLLMTGFALFYGWYQESGLSLDWLRFVPALAVGLIASAGIKIGRKTVTNFQTAGIFLASAVLVILINQAWSFPLILAAGGLIHALLNRKPGPKYQIKTKLLWGFLILFLSLFGGIELLAWFTDIRFFAVGEVFYRYGSLVFGGGQVLIPMMFEEMVNLRGWMSSEDFYTGYALVQGVPGPVFSFSAFAGGMSASEFGTGYQVLSSFLSALCLFLPGALLIFFVYPIWNDFKKHPWVASALPGINAAAAGFVAAAAWMFLQELPYLWPDLFIAAGVLIVLMWEKVPAPVLVVVCLLLGFL